MRKAVVLLLPIFALCACNLGTRTGSRPDTATLLAGLGGTPCPDSEFTCVSITVPLDHKHPSDWRTTRVTFGVLPATGERKGMFVTAIGGPGSAGLMYADSNTSAFDPSIHEHFDIVFFDQRGIGLSGGLDCPQAGTGSYPNDKAPSYEQQVMGSLQTFVQSCMTEMGNPEIIPFLGTDQAVEDLETFRRLMGDDKIWLYGQSYGTMYAQTYAAAHPNHLAGLILDGTVDLTLSGPEFMEGQARAFNDVLLATLQSCDEQESCSRAMGAEAETVYDELSGQLYWIASLPFDFPLPSGGIASREFTYWDLESAVSSYMYTETRRMIFLRALASYARDGDLVPMARILYESLSIDPETLADVPEPWFSSAVNLAVTCEDYALYSGTPLEQIEAYLSAGEDLDATLPNMSSVFYGDLLCVVWPDARQDLSRPAPLIADGIPTLVLNATTDPATPYSGAQAVYSHLDQGYLITEEGGPHIIFGSGNACVDDLVTAFLVSDQLPSRAETVCPGEVSRPFVDLAPLGAASKVITSDAFSLLVGAVDEFRFLPEYYYWDVKNPTTIGCAFGGTWKFESLDVGEAYTLNDCSFSAGFVMSGNGTFIYDPHVFTLNITVKGLARGSLTYTRDIDGAIHVTGDYAGQTIDASQ